MKISVKIADIEVSYEENNQRTTLATDKEMMSCCIQKALKLYLTKTKEEKND